MGASSWPLMTTVAVLLALVESTGASAGVTLYDPVDLAASVVSTVDVSVPPATASPRFGDCGATLFNTSIVNAANGAFVNGRTTSLRVDVPDNVTLDIRACRATGLWGLRVVFALGRNSALWLSDWDVEVGGMTIEALQGGSASLEDAVVVIGGRSRILAATANPSTLGSSGRSSSNLPDDDVHALSVVGPAAVRRFALVVTEGSTVRAIHNGTGRLFATACVVRAVTDEANMQPIAMPIEDMRIVVGGHSMVEAHVISRLEIPRAHAVTVSTPAGCNVTIARAMFAAVDGSSVVAWGQASSAALGFGISAFKRDGSGGAAAVVLTNVKLMVSSSSAMARAGFRGAGTAALGIAAYLSSTTAISDVAIHAIYGSNVSVLLDTDGFSAAALGISTSTGQIDARNVTLYAEASSVTVTCARNGMSTTAMGISTRSGRMTTNNVFGYAANSHISVAVGEKCQSAASLGFAAYNGGQLFPTDSAFVATDNSSVGVSCGMNAQGASAMGVAASASCDVRVRNATFYARRASNISAWCGEAGVAAAALGTRENTGSTILVKDVRFIRCSLPALTGHPSEDVAVWEGCSEPDCSFLEHDEASGNCPPLPFRPPPMVRPSFRATPSPSSVAEGTRSRTLDMNARLLSTPSRSSRSVSIITPSPSVGRVTTVVVREIPSSSTKQALATATRSVTLGTSRAPHPPKINDMMTASRSKTASVTFAQRADIDVARQDLGSSRIVRTAAQTAAAVAVVAAAALVPGVGAVSAATAPARLGASLRLGLCDGPVTVPSFAALPGLPPSAACAVGSSDCAGTRRDVAVQTATAAALLLLLTALGAVLAVTTKKIAGMAGAFALALLSVPAGYIAAPVAEHIVAVGTSDRSDRYPINEGDTNTDAGAIAVATLICVLVLALLFKAATVVTSEVLHPDRALQRLSRAVVTAFVNTHDVQNNVAARGVAHVLHRYATFVEILSAVVFCALVGARLERPWCVARAWTAIAVAGAFVIFVVMVKPLRSLSTAAEHRFQVAVALVQLLQGAAIAVRLHFDSSSSSRFLSEEWEEGVGTAGMALVFAQAGTLAVLSIVDRQTKTSRNDEVPKADGQTSSLFLVPRGGGGPIIDEASASSSSAPLLQIVAAAVDVPSEERRRLPPAALLAPQPPRAAAAAASS